MLLPALAEAQALRGTVVDAETGTRVPGAVLVAIDPTSRAEVARGQATERGAFLLRLPAPGSVAVRVLRLGYRPIEAGPFRVAGTDTVSVTITAGAMRTTLARVDVRGSRECVQRPDSAGLVAGLLGEAQVALASSTVSPHEEHGAEVETFQRIESTRGALLVPVARTLRRGLASRPFTSIRADSLERVGYMVQEGDSTAWYAPDADVLLSDAFARRHCFRAVEGTGARASSIGIGFRPVRSGGLVGVSGTLWLDRTTRSLQALEYRYEGLPSHLRDAGLGGEVEFTRLESDRWIVSRWRITMPRVALRRQLQHSAVSPSMAVRRPVLEGLLVVGGEVRRLESDGAVLYASAPADPETVTDSVATPRIGGDLEALHALFPTCREGIQREYEGVVSGRVLDARRRGAGEVPVRAAWNEEFRRVGERTWSWKKRELTAESTAGGLYLMCGLPIARPVSVTAVYGGEPSRTAVVRVNYRALHAVADLTWRAGEGPGRER